MKTGMEQDPNEEFDREFSRAIAAAARAHFGCGDLREALQRVDRLAKGRMAANGHVSQLHA